MGQLGVLKKSNVQRIQYAVTALAMLLLTFAFSALASGATLTSRSITPSTASITGGDEVQYNVEFTAGSEAGALVIEFCSNTPVIGQSCTAPTGLDVSEATSTDVTIVDTHTTANKITATGTIDDAANEILFEDITNPSVVGNVYARILTYANSAAAQAYTSSSIGSAIDQGSVAMYFNSSIAVSGTVLETLTFCVSGADIDPNCEGAVAPASIRLGEETAQGSGIFALTTSTVSTGELYAQVNTNAVNGAIVRLRSSATCGGLMRLGSNECNVAAALQTGIAAGEAKFGVMLAEDYEAGELTEEQTVGTLRPYDGGTGAYYSTSAYAFNYDNTHAVGVTSPFGDPFLDTNNAPAANRNMLITFGASIANNTPAGTYSTDLNMIAVGKF